MSTAIIGRVVSLAVRPARSADMQLTSALTVKADGCAAGDHSKSAKRGITILSSPQWDQVISAMQSDLPWHARRANVLVDASDLGQYVGKHIKLGNVEIQVMGITYPCAHIEDLHPGLSKALKGDRGGIYGRILNDGVIQIDDVMMAS